MALNASYFLKGGGHFVISIKVCFQMPFSNQSVIKEVSVIDLQNLLATFQANCIDSTVPAEAVFAQEVKKLQAEMFKPSEQVTLEPFERDHACVVGGYRMPKKQKATA